MATDSSATAAERAPRTNGLLIYDADCGFCTTSAHWYADHVADDDHVASWQSLDLDAYGLTPEQTSAAACWVRDGQVRSGADAIARALIAGGGLWRLAGTALSVPPLIWLGRLVYPVIARNRHKLPGASDACRI